MATRDSSRKTQSTGHPPDDWLDASRPVRDGEELDLDRLAEYLRRHLPGGTKVAEGDERELVVEQFPSGFSNLTYLLRLGEQDLVLRRPPFGNRVKSAHDMGREHRVLSALAEIYPLAPRPLLYCDDEDVLGAPFYVMERRHGVILRRRLPPGLVLDAQTACKLSETFADRLAELHGLDYAGAGLADLGKPEGYVRRQVEGWAERYRRARTHDWKLLEEVLAWLLAELDAQEPHLDGAALVHNDYKYDNLVLDPEDLTRMVAVLDWEMCTLGSPLMDLGNSLAYWVEARDPEPWVANAFGPTHAPGSLTRRQLADRYGQTAGGSDQGLLYAYVFGIFRLAVIGQQIYYRYAQGLTQDPRFASLDQMVGLCGEVAARALDRDQV
ncbi:MAG: phosphotransferase family protein [Acidobacteriota bacterium]|nr:phosphotransferase family protein [Acidobacteriota bacterium]